jgi:hypothetical protein
MYYLVNAFIIIKYFYGIKGSPGNLTQFEDILYGSEDQSNPICDPGIMALQLTIEDSINVSLFF